VWLNASGIAELRAHSFVAYVDEDGVVRLPKTEVGSVQVGSQVDPIKDRQDWGQVRVNQNPQDLSTSPAGLYLNGYPSGSDATWDWASGVQRPFINQGEGAHIYIVDTGILAEHQEFGGRVIVNVSFITGNSSAADCNGHGTHCAGSAAGQWRGVAVGATLGNVRVLSCGGSGSWSDVIAGFDFVANNQVHGKANILSASLGGGKTQSVDDSINACARAGVIPVCSAGNSNNNACLQSPGGAGMPVCVAATQAPSDGIASFSSYGPCVTVSAPGVNIHSSYWTSANSPTAYATLSGTSMATPLTAGAIAVYVTKIGEQPGVERVKQAIKDFGKPVVTGLTGLKINTTSLLIDARWNFQ